MHKNMKVSAIMSVYNEGNTAYGIITWVLAQAYVDRLIMVYNRSTDNTLKEVNSAIRGSDGVVLKAFVARNSY